MIIIKLSEGNEVFSVIFVILKHNIHAWVSDVVDN